jgi:carboxymethylenebutenolidase
VTGSWVPLAGSDDFRGYLALPPSGSGPGILLLQEIFGVNEHIRGVAEQYAMDGYVALAPDLFWRQQPRLELGYGSDDVATGVGIARKLDFPQTLKDLTSAVQTLRGLPECRGKVASVGFCLGGTLAYLSAAQAMIDAAVCYYGSGISTQLDLAARIKSPILFHYGAKDNNIPASAVESVRQAFTGRESASVHVYPDADHGFNCWARGTYQQRAAALAHGRTLEFLAATI